MKRNVKPNKTKEDKTMVPVRRNQNWLPSIFNDFLGNDWLVERRNTTSPAVNILENDDEYKVEVAAPGMTKEDFKVHLNEDNEVEGGGQGAQGHLPAPRIFLHAVPAEPAAARQRRARQDFGQGRERRDDHCDPETQGDGSRFRRPADRDQVKNVPEMKRDRNTGPSFFVI